MNEKLLRNNLSDQSMKRKTPGSNKFVCFNCRSKLDEGSVYCSNCGQNQKISE